MKDDTSFDRAPADDPLAVLTALGLSWPTAWTVARLLKTVAEHGLAPRSAAQRYADCHSATAFARQGGASEALTAAGRSLAVEISRRADSSPEIVEAVRSALTPPPAPAVDPIPPDIPPPPPNDYLDAFDIEPSGSDVPVGDTDSTSGRHSKRWRAILAIGAVLIVWTAATLVIGAWQTDKIRFLTHRVGHLVGIRTSGDRAGVLDAARIRAVREPESRQAWQRYARIADQQGRDMEAVIALDHLIARSPQDAEFLNELAWMLCTTNDKRVHDGVRCLDLARRAYAIDKSPAITDTLAEALFQTGDPVAAVTLELQALAAIGEDAPFYRRQLEKFRRAAVEHQKAPDSAPEDGQ